ncbi:MAG: hypothetical protein Q9160_002989 [Pyrenula sp. 1 TL-2023]
MSFTIRLSPHRGTGRGEDESGDTSLDLPEPVPDVHVETPEYSIQTSATHIDVRSKSDRRAPLPYISHNQTDAGFASTPLVALSKGSQHQNPEAQERSCSWDLFLLPGRQFVSGLERQKEEDVLVSFITMAFLILPIFFLIAGLCAPVLLLKSDEHGEAGKELQRALGLRT